MMPNKKTVKKAQHIPYLTSTLNFKVTYKGKKINFLIFPYYTSKEVPFNTDRQEKNPFFIILKIVCQKH